MDRTASEIGYPDRNQIEKVLSGIFTTQIGYLEAAAPIGYQRRYLGAPPHAHKHTAVTARTREWIMSVGHSKEGIQQAQSGWQQWAKLRGQGWPPTVFMTFNNKSTQNKGT